MNHALIEPIRALAPIAGVRAFFIGRIPNLDITMPREEAMARLKPVHQRLLEAGPGAKHFLVTAEQVHGNKVGIVTAPVSEPLPGVDGLITARRGLTLGIYVADCAPVWIVARNGSAGGLLHSGKKGTELGIVPVGIRTLRDSAGIAPRDLIAVIGPCIRPPCYEMDFAAEIRRQASSEGITEIHDALVCTACHPERYYSYRRDKGLTGRMLATLTLLP